MVTQMAIAMAIMMVSQMAITTVTLTVSLMATPIDTTLMLAVLITETVTDERLEITSAAMVRSSAHKLTEDSTRRRWQVRSEQ